jgi:RNA 3'-terminal phosphate cyclase
MRNDVAFLTADTKTAGSICLLSQVSLPCCVFGNAPSITLTLKGGTNAIQAPSVDYMIHIFLKLITKFGIDCSGNKMTKSAFFTFGMSPFFF